MLSSYYYSFLNKIKEQLFLDQKCAAVTFEIPVSLPSRKRIKFLPKEAATWAR